MASTGVSVADAVIAQFNDLKLGRIQPKPKFIIYKIEGPQIVTEHVSSDDNFNAFLDLLPADDCRYAIYDMNFKTNDGRDGNKLVNITW